MRRRKDRGSIPAWIRSGVFGILSAGAILIELGCGSNLTSAPNPSAFGQSVTFTDTVVGNAPTGTVTFRDGTTPLATVPLTSGIAAFTTSTLSLGMHSIVGDYSGDVNNAPNSSNTDVQVVNATAANYFVVAPCRLVDTRGNAGPYGAPALAANTARTFQASPQCGIADGATALAINVTVTSPTSDGDLRIFAAGSTPPSTSTLNYGTSGTRANNAEIGLGPGGAFTVYVDQASGTVDLIVDVTGYFQ